MRWWSRLRAALRRWIVAIMTRVLTKPLVTYEQRVPNSLARLKQYLRPGDVILVEGEQRISQVIRYLTQSSWSHAGLYIGDELPRFAPTLAAVLAAEHGDDAHWLMIEAEAERGVVCTPITRYVQFNLRVCRPRGLRREDLDHIIAELVAQLGRPYSVRRIVDLGRYFFPVSVIPRRFHRAALQHGGDATRQVICSTMLARAFAHVGYPVLPQVTVDPAPAPARWLRRLLGVGDDRPRLVYHPRDPDLITPRDFDLSPYFDIVKFNYLTGEHFDYRRIQWVRDEAESPAPLPADDVGPDDGKTSP